jgi:hypothetical protein
VDTPISGDYEARKEVSRGGWRIRKEAPRLAPNNAFLVEKVINDFDTVTHLSLCTLGHGNDGATNLARLDIVERRNTVRTSSLELLFVACHAWPPPPIRQFLRRNFVTIIAVYY